MTAHARQVLGLGLVLGTLAALARHDDADPETITLLARLNERVGLREIAEYGASILGGLLEHKDGPEGGGMIWIVTTNRQVQFATLDSVPTVKGDAARQLFAIDCSDLTWAILDSGIQRDHPAFEAPDKTSRVRRTYDFGQITRILDRRNGRNAAFCRETAERLVNRGVRGEKLEQDIKRCAQSSRGGIEAVDWFTVEKLVRIDNPAPPTNPHGTHVAGILAGQWARAPRSEQNTALPGTDVATFIAEPIRRPAGKEQGTVLLRGVCPDINLHDFRVLGQDCEQTEFAVICALQFIRHLNARSGKAVIDGVNLSLSIPHDVLSYACGKTPVCLEAEKLVANGTVVVAAAGNNGYQSYRLSAGGAYDGYAFASITDPGNAETVITVGSTHRFAPHTYGVSYFSSRGPTGDGRAKPDILAPGEKIASAVPGNAMDTMDGTSMAAPHVSGAAALLMGRNREMRGDPATIKQVLCDTATDVGRIAHFQGHGLLDILRALQSK
ncbi:MAG: S8 family serine peptidase [Novosphingobium sp.]